MLSTQGGAGQIDTGTAVVKTIVLDDPRALVLLKTLIFSTDPSGNGSIGNGVGTDMPAE
jgi:hypothetical protein